MTDAAPTTVEDMFVQTASGVRTDGGTMTLLGLTPHTIYFSDRPQRIVGHITTHRFLQWWSEGDDSFAADPPNAVLAWGERFDSPLWEGRRDGFAYVCHNYACEAPTDTDAGLLALL